MENFWSTLKIELVYRTSWRTRDEADNAIFPGRSRRQRIRRPQRLLGQGPAKAGPPPRDGPQAATTRERWQQIHALLDKGVGLLECGRNLLHKYINQGRIESDRPGVSPRRLTSYLLTHPDHRGQRQQSLFESLTRRSRDRMIPHGRRIIRYQNSQSMPDINRLGGSRLSPGACCAPGLRSYVKPLTAYAASGEG